jgi:hypothetical protein
VWRCSRHMTPVMPASGSISSKAVLPTMCRRHRVR